MKIGIVALNYIPGTIGGAESYFIDLIKNLQEVDKENTYVIFMRNKYNDLLPITNNRFSIKLIASNNLSFLLSKVLRKFFRLDYPQIIINKQRCDLLHFPFQIVPFAGLKTKVLSTAIDIQEEYYPDFFTPEDLANRQRLHLLSVQRSSHLVAISNFTRDTYIKKYDIAKDKISTVHLSYNEDLYNTRKKRSALELPSKYLYYPAATWPHKNHKSLIRAFSQFHKSNPDYSLVLSGIKKQQSREIEELAKELGIRKNVLLLGYVDRSALPELYHRAVATVFPSLFEGFGIPVLEAMACGCPVICSNTSSLPEVGGAAAIYFDPTDVAEITSSMNTIARDSKLRNKMIINGLKHAKLFSARKTALQTLAIYERLGKNDE